MQGSSCNREFSFSNTSLENRVMCIIKLIVQEPLRYI